MDGFSPELLNQLLGVINAISQATGIPILVGAGAAGGIVILTQSLKALFPKVINNSRNLYVVFGQALLVSLVTFWPTLTTFKGILGMLLTTGFTGLTAIGLWSGAKTMVHKAGTVASNASGGAKPTTTA